MGNNNKNQPDTAQLFFSCPYCGQHLSADQDMTGMEVECPSCAGTIRVPSQCAKDIKDVQNKTNAHRKWLVLTISIILIVSTSIIVSNMWDGEHDKDASLRVQSKSAIPRRPNTDVHKKESSEEMRRENNTTRREDAFQINGIVLGDFVKPGNWGSYRFCTVPNDTTKHDFGSQEERSFPISIAPQAPYFSGKERNVICSSYKKDAEIELFDLRFMHIFYVSTRNRIFATRLYWSKVYGYSPPSSMEELTRILTSLQAEISKVDDIKNTLEKKYGKGETIFDFDEFKVVSWQKGDLLVFLSCWRKGSDNSLSVTIEYVSQSALMEARKDCGLVGGRTVDDIKKEAARDIL